MAGSLRHIIAADGSLTFALVDSGGDRIEALEECFDIIAVLCDGDPRVLDRACEKLGYAPPDRLPKAGARDYRMAPPIRFGWPP